MFVETTDEGAGTSRESSIPETAVPNRRDAVTAVAPARIRVRVASDLQEREELEVHRDANAPVREILADGEELPKDRTERPSTVTDVAPDVAEFNLTAALMAGASIVMARESVPPTRAPLDGAMQQPEPMPDETLVAM